MDSQLETLRKSTHAKTRLAKTRTYSQFAEVVSIPVVIDEVILAAREYVVVVPDNGQNMPHVLTGLKGKTNLYVGRDGAWMANYIPLDIRRRPFGLSPIEGLSATEDQRHTVVADMSSPELDGGGGEFIFGSDGKLSAAADERVRIAEYLVNRQKDTQDVIQAAEAVGLLKPVQIELTSHNKRQRVSGIRIVDKEKLNSLSEKDFSALHKKGVLSFAYAQMMSMENLRQGVLAGQISPAKASAATEPAKKNGADFDLSLFASDDGDFELS